MLKSTLQKPHRNYLPLAITAGEPAGIGPDLIVKWAQTERPLAAIVFADPSVLSTRATQLQLPLTIKTVMGLDERLPPVMPAHTVFIYPVILQAPCTAGVLEVANAAYVLETLRLATTACLNHQCSALVTAPVHKGIINEAGIAFSGHTEFLAELAGVPQVVMMLTSARLKVALTTTHLPLADVAKAITPEKLTRVLQVLHAGLQQHFNIADPHIVVAGLNPHAGENGHLGREEIEVITPVISRLQQQGMRLTGPLPADTLFTPQHLQHADAVLAMYHDQGLPVLKYQGFGEAVNVTLGLPFLRTSVDHGTALSLAGTGNIDMGSFMEAVILGAD